MKTLSAHVSLAAMLIIAGCNQKTENSEVPSDDFSWKNHIPFVTDYKTFSMAVSDEFNPIPESIGEVKLSETSGLGWSRANKGMIWAHNDSGHPNKIFLIDSETGEIMAHYVILGSSNIDWEDMEVAAGHDPQLSYVYVSDFGDNKEIRPDYSIYRFPEPVYDSTHYGQTIFVSDPTLDHIKFVYPDESHDAEALIVDPHTLDIFIVTKRDEVSMLYVVPFPQKTDTIYPIFKVGSFSFREVTAGTASHNGDKVMIKNYQEIFYWERQPEETMTEMLSRTPIKAPYAAEPKGEAICFDQEGNYYTLSEAIDEEQIPVLYKYAIKR